jgi:hypothetical protein
MQSDFHSVQYFSLLKNINDIFNNNGTNQAEVTAVLWLLQGCETTLLLQLDNTNVSIK